MGTIKKTQVLKGSKKAEVFYFPSCQNSSLCRKDNPLHPFPIFGFVCSMDATMDLCCLALSISYLNARKLAPATVTSYLSCISYVRKIAGVHDPSKIRDIQKLSRGISRSRSADIRMHITRSVLHHEMVGSLQHTNYSASLYNLLVRSFEHTH